MSREGASGLSALAGGGKARPQGHVFRNGEKKGGERPAGKKVIAFRLGEKIGAPLETGPKDGRDFTAKRGGRGSST